MKAINKAKSEFVTDVRLLEVFEDDARIGSDKKSLLFQVKIQPKDGQLTKEEIDNHIMHNIFMEIKSIGGLVRDGVSES